MIVEWLNRPITRIFESPAPTVGSAQYMPDADDFTFGSAEGEELRRRVSDPWYTFIKEGKKTVEGRIVRPNGPWAKLKVGDTVTFYLDPEHPEDDKIRVEITHIKHYKDFEEYLDKESLEKTLPGVKNNEEGLEIYKSFFKDPEEIKKHGVTAFGIKLLKK